MNIMNQTYSEAELERLATFLTKAEAALDAACPDADFILIPVMAGDKPEHGIFTLSSTMDKATTNRLLLHCLDIDENDGEFIPADHLPKEST